MTSRSYDFIATQDMVDDDDESVKLTFGTLPARVSTGTTDETTLNITDDDTADIVLDPASLAVEEGDTSSYTVKLATEPTTTVSVTITGHAGTDLTLSGTTLNSDALTFTATNWDMPQTVTVAADQDDDASGESVTLTHTGGGGEYAALQKELTVSITDDDTPDIELSTETLILEESESGSYTVRLATEPTAAVTVTVTGHAGTDVTLGGTALTNNALTFSTANWSAPQTVTVDAAHDDDSTSDRVTLTHTATGGDYAGVMDALSMIVTDDDTGTLRLVDGTLTDDEGNLCEGRLEIFYNGAWGTICDDYWTDEDADVACRQLGFVGGSVDDWERFRNSYFPPGSGDQAIILDDMSCAGGESELLDCPSNHPRPGLHDCKHEEDVGIRCIKNSEGPYITGMVISGPPGGQRQVRRGRDGDGGGDVERSGQRGRPAARPTPYRKPPPAPASGIWEPGRPQY